MMTNKYKKIIIYNIQIKKSYIKITFHNKIFMYNYDELKEIYISSNILYLDKLFNSIKLVDKENIENIININIFDIPENCVKKINIPVSRNFSIIFNNELNQNKIIKLDINITKLDKINFVYINFNFKNIYKEVLSNIFNKLNEKKINILKIENLRYIYLINIYNVKNLKIKNSHIDKLDINHANKVLLEKTNINELIIDKIKNSKLNIKNLSIKKLFNKNISSLSIIDTNIKKGIIKEADYILIDEFKDNLEYIKFYIDKMLFDKEKDIIKKLDIIKIDKLFIKLVPTEWLLKNIEIKQYKSIEIFFYPDINVSEYENIDYESLRDYLFILIELLEYHFYTLNLNININIDNPFFLKEDIKAINNINITEKTLLLYSELERLIECNKYAKKDIINKYEKILNKYFDIFLSINFEINKLKTSFINNNTKRYINKIAKKTNYKLSSI